MTAASELFVTETIQGMVQKRLNKEVLLVPNDKWLDIWDEAAFPDKGTASIYLSHNDEPIGIAVWKTSFHIVKLNSGIRTIEAEVKDEDLEIFSKSG